MVKKISQEEKVVIDIDDEIALLYERIKLKYGVSWAKARDLVNNSIRFLYCSCCENEFINKYEKKGKNFTWEQIIGGKISQKKKNIMKTIIKTIKNLETKKEKIVSINSINDKLRDNINLCDIKEGISLLMQVGDIFKPKRNYVLRTVNYKNK